MKNKEVYMETGQSRVAYDQSSTPGRTLTQADPPRLLLSPLSES